MGIRVLVIEDDEEIAEFVVRGLREEGFIVDRAADGDSGWHALQSGRWDVVVLDWWLPGPDGLTLPRRFRQSGAESPVLFLTAWDAVSDKVRGLDHGADEYLCKPFDYVVRAGRDGDSFRLSVEDQGVGIAADELARVVEPFYRAAQARSRDPKGFGLGFTVASRLARLFDGRLQVESLPGRGSTFSVVLPATTRRPPFDQKSVSI